MTVKQVKKFYQGKKGVECELTQKLIKAGYRQANGGYIDEYRRKKQCDPDFKKAEPSQWWHLIEAYCANKQPADTCKIWCGELCFWMAEVSGAFSKEELEHIRITALKKAGADDPPNESPNTLLDTTKAGRYIQKECWSRIVNAVKMYDTEHT